LKKDQPVLILKQKKFQENRNEVRGCIGGLVSRSAMGEKQKGKREGLVVQKRRDPFAARCERVEWVRKGERSIICSEKQCCH